MTDGDLRSVGGRGSVYGDPDKDGEEESSRRTKIPQELSTRDNGGVLWIYSNLDWCVLSSRLPS